MSPGDTTRPKDPAELEAIKLGLAANDHQAQETVGISVQLGPAELAALPAARRFEIATRWV